jgi:hypothetical protein
MNKLFLIVIISLLSVTSSYAGGDSTLRQREDSLYVLLNNLRESETNKELFASNTLFKDYLHETITNENAFSYRFHTLTTLGSIYSPDSSLRIFTWNIELEDFSQKYFCYIMHLNDRTNSFDIIELVDNSMMIPARPTEVLAANEWYGALYYKIIPKKKGSKMYYTLLGYDANNTMSNIKLIDVLYFTGKTAKLGYPFFKTKEETLKRVFFEHSEKAYMSLKYEEQYDRVIYDHLSPETPSMTGYYSYYVPDFSYDAFVYHKDKWVLVEDVIGVNKATNKDLVVLVDKNNDGKVKEVKLKNSWVDPSDSESPEQNIHVAVLPSQKIVNPTKEKKNKISRSKRKKRNEPISYLNPYMKKKKRSKNRK